jgi:anti-sigma factor RsiW
MLPGKEERVSERIGHLASETLQAYLEGELASSVHRDVEAHLGECRRCAAELEGWSLLFRGLDELPELGPSEGFQERVLGQLPGRSPSPAGLWDRIRSLVTGAGSTASDHLSPERIQDLLDGALGGRSRRRAAAHLAACDPCRTEAKSWKTVFQSLSELAVFAPSAGFAERVMAAVEPREVRGRAPAPVRVGAWILGELRAAARSLVPSTRKGWALAGGIVAAPTVGLLVVLGAVAAHPLLTVGDLAAFVSWRAGDAVGAMAGWVLGQMMGSPLLSQAYGWLEVVAASPGIAVTGLLALWAVMLGAGLVLYRNVISPLFVVDRHVR